MKLKYSRQQIFLHWISAVVIIWATVSGFYVAIFAPPLTVREWVSFFNVSITTIFIPLFIWRVICALTKKKPAETKLSPRQVRMAYLGHIILYANISFVMVTGVLMMDRDINVFNLFSFPQPLTDAEFIGFFRQIHIASCVTLALLVIGHILAVIKHTLAGKNIINRMLP